MERKTAQRIVGVLVFIALIVISLPLLFGGSNADAPVQTTEVKAPPFPDQDTQTSVTISQNTADAINPTQSTMTIEKSDPQTATDTINTAADTFKTAANNTPVAPSSVTENNPAISEAQNTTSSKTIEPHDQSINTAQNNASATVVATSETNSASSTGVELAKVATNTSQANPQSSTEVLHNTVASAEDVSDSTEKPTIKSKKNKHTKVASNHSDITAFKGAAWVVQMGNFKNKMNALRLANQLRALGYKAFTQNHGNSVRVYVGPEFQQASANSLANKIQEKISMQGIVISYHPMEI
jgi:cell division septation protein DedD